MDPTFGFAYLTGFRGNCVYCDGADDLLVRNRSGAGEYNWGNYRVPELDSLIDRAEGETHPAKRQPLIIAAMQRHHDDVLHIPLHIQISPWVSKASVGVAHRADSWVEVAWVRM